MSHARTRDAAADNKVPPDSTALLTIDLNALIANYDRLRELAAPAECAAVVKADDVNSWRRGTDERSHVRRHATPFEKL